MPKTLVLFGGTFDPVHHGHLIVARALAETCGLPCVTFVPACRPPHKPATVADGRHRLAMLRLAVEGQDALDVCDIELVREGPSYTLETVRQFRRQHGADADIRWVIGADMLAELPTWHRAEELLAEVRFLVVARWPWQKDLEAILASVASAVGKAAAARLREGLVSTPLVDISATEIRARIRQGLSIRYLLPEAVGRYIDQHGLYR